MKFTFAPEATPLAGYTIKRAIDRGGFGEVYYALSDSGKEVALKLLQRNQQVELRGVRQCLNLKHPNLVTIFDIRTDADEDHWVVMEFVSGKSLEQVLDEHPQGLPIAEVEEWLAGIAAGIGFLHDRGIVHRDLKPANVFRENGVVKIGDIGLSKFITPSRRSAQTESVGTVYYMAPEVARGKYGSELDVYSLGVMLYEMLTGQVPFNGESTGEILMKHLTEPPDLARVTSAFRPVLARALEKDPQRRTPCALQLLEEFRQALRGKPVAEEIPASHFFGRSEPRPQTPRDPAPQGTPFPAGGNGTAPYNNPHRSPAGSRAANGAAGTRDKETLTGWPFVQKEIGRNRWLLAAIILLALSISPFSGHRSFARGLPLFGMAFPAALAYVSFWFVTNYRNLSPCGEKHAHGWKPWCAGPKPAQRAQPVSSPPVVTVRYENRPAAATPPPVAQAPQPTAKTPSPKPKVEVLNPNTIRELPLRSRLAGLSSAMTLTVFWSVAATALLGTISNSWSMWNTWAGQKVSDPAHAGLFALTTILGAWSILVLSKLSEGRGPETTTRRIAVTLCGGIVGACAWWIGQALFVELPFRSAFPGLFSHVFQYPLLGPSQAPTLAGFVTYFAALFALRRWWWQADGYRHNRLRLRSWIWSGAVAFFVPALFAFPQAWGVAWGLAISAVVQLSAPWIPENQRSAPAKNVS